MAKIIKRINKSVEEKRNCIVIGDAFGHLSNISEMFFSIFVILNQSPRIKAKNIIYRETLDDLHMLPEVTCVFLDLKHITKLDFLENLMIKIRPIFLIEGNEVIGREFTKKFYQLGYRAVEQQGYFHIWRKMV